MDKRGNPWVETKFNKTTKEILILLIIVMIIMNMQTKLCTIFSALDDQSTASL